MVGDGGLTRDASAFFRTSSPRQCLEVLELAQKYEMIETENFLHSHLEQRLPVSASDPLDAYDKYDEYIRDPPLALLALRVGSPKITPWAFYVFGVRLSGSFNPKDKATYAPPPRTIHRRQLLHISVNTSAAHHLAHSYDVEGSNYFILSERLPRHIQPMFANGQNTNYSRSSSLTS